MKKGTIKFLADVNIEKPVVDFLVKNGFDVKWVTNIDKQMQDVAVFRIANAEQRIILTNDKDFGEMCFFQKKTSHGIILLRIKGQDSFKKIGLLKKLLERYPDKIIKHFVIVKENKFRFIPLEVI